MEKNTITIEMPKDGQVEILEARGATMGLTGAEYAAAVVSIWLESGQTLTLQEA